MRLLKLTNSDLAAFNAWLDEIIDTPFGQFDRGEFFLFSTGCRCRDRGLSWLKAAFKAGLDEANKQKGKPDER